METPTARRRPRLAVAALRFVTDIEVLREPSPHVIILRVRLRGVPKDGAKMLREYHAKWFIGDVEAKAVAYVNSPKWADEVEVYLTTSSLEVPFYAGVDWDLPEPRFSVSKADLNDETNPRYGAIRQTLEQELAAFYRWHECRRIMLVCTRPCDDADEAAQAEEAPVESLVQLHPRAPRAEVINRRARERALGTVRCAGSTATASVAHDHDSGDDGPCAA